MTRDTSSYRRIELPRADRDVMKPDVIDPKTGRKIRTEAPVSVVRNIEAKSVADYYWTGTNE